MAKIVKFRSKQHHRRRDAEVSVAVNGDLGNDANLRNLIDEWIVPKMVERWMDQSKADLKLTETNDNGEHK